MKVVEIIVPVFNEYEVIDEFLIQVEQIIKLQNNNFKLVLTIVDDGSEIDFQNKLKVLQKSYNFKIIFLTKNLGQQLALRAGIDNSNSDALIMMDVDLQDPPSLINNMLSKWNEGSDVVHTIRTERKKESFFKKLTAKIYYKVANKNSKFNLTQNSGDFKLIDKSIVNQIKETRDGNLYLRGLIDYLAISPAYINYVRQPRFSGKRKYKYSQSLKLALSGLVSFSDFFHNLLIKLMIFSTFILFLLVLYFLKSLQNFELLVKGWSSVISMLLFINFIQIFGFIFLGTYLKKIDSQTSGRKNYTIKEISTID